MNLEQKIESRGEDLHGGGYSQLVPKDQRVKERKIGFSE